jgi:pimeloyl-ACP methyl ester carboxylesterase
MLRIGLTVPYQTKYVNIGKVIDGSDDVRVWTFTSNTNKDGIPIVLIHGFGSGLAMWVKNLEEISKGPSPVLAIDLPGTKSYLIMHP